MDTTEVAGMVWSWPTMEMGMPMIGGGCFWEFDQLEAYMTNNCIEFLGSSSKLNLVTKEDRQIADCGHSKLDPSAKEWNFLHNRASEQDRCLYLTFSNGYPLSEVEIIDFFHRKFGECVESVYVHWPERRKQPALFGKVVFSKSLVPAAVLAGEEKAKFFVKGKTMWCKKFQRTKSSCSYNKT